MYKRQEYSINGGAWTGCPVGDPTVTITAGGETTVTARVVDGAGNASGQTATAKVYIDPAPPNVPGVTLSTEQWTNSTVMAVSYTHLPHQQPDVEDHYKGASK